MSLTNLFDFDQSHLYGAQTLANMEREYKDLSSKLSEIHKMCNNEIEEIFKEHLKENDEVRICMGYDDEGNGFMMKDTYNPIIYHITSIGGKMDRSGKKPLNG